MAACPRPSSGAVVGEPEDLRSHNGVLKLELTVHNEKESDGSFDIATLARMVKNRLLCEPLPGISSSSS